MPSSSRSKSKGKKAGKESSKASLKPSGHVNSDGVISASRCNPLLGAFHALETEPVPSASLLHVHGRSQNIDDEDQNENSFGNGIEYDSFSNNGSWSGDSEDHKEKTSQMQPRQETVAGADNDKREKIRQKNEKKHQRQKEKRAQELHERCSGYLMSRKLEALAQQLVSMGFSQERATMALILNEGRVEESVAWLFEGGADDKSSEQSLDGRGNLKIDITEELARITEMEVRYKVSKQEVERVVVTCEGDLAMADETLKAQKREPPASPPKPEETSDLPAANGKLQIVSSQNSVRVLLTRPSSSTSIQQKKAEKDFNYTKLPTTTAPPLDPGAKRVQGIPPKFEWPKPQQITLPSEKRSPVPGPNPSVSYSIASSLQASPPPGRTKSHHVAIGKEMKGLQIGSAREPVIVMQRPQSISLKQTPTSIISSSPPGTAMGRYPNHVETTMPNGLQPDVTRSLSPHGISSIPSFNQLHYRSQQQFVSGYGQPDPQGTRQTSSWSGGCPSPTIAAASSLGLFSGPGINGSSGSSSPVDWTTGISMFQCDYSNIDWSMDRCGMSTYQNGSWTTTHMHNPFSYGSNFNPAMRPVLSNGSVGAIPGLQGRVASSETSNDISLEWTTPFEERDLFGLSRQFVSFPSL